MRRTIVIIGAGGFAREVKWLIDELNRVTPTFDFRGYVVTDLAKLGEHDSRDEVLGDCAWLDENHVDCAALGIGTPGARLRVSTELTRRFGAIEWPALVHPSVHFDRSTSTLERGVLVCAATVGTVNLHLEEFCMVNLACTLGHEARLGRASVLNPTVNISGGVTIGDAVLVGTGAQVLQYVAVGRGATVGAGAVVTKDVAAGETVVGIPARRLDRST